MTVTLTLLELQSAAGTGVSRRLVSLKQNNDAYKHTKNSNWSTDIEGAAAEMAFAKMMQLYCAPTVNTFKLADVANVQVRSTPYRGGHLLIRPNDADEDIFVLMVGSYTTWKADGWAYGREAKIDEHWRDGGDGEAGCWWVPGNKLRPIKTLDEKIKGRSNAA